MMKLSVLDKNGKDTGRTVELAAGVFGVEPNNHALYLDAKQYLANQRQGTHKTKERAEVIGSTRKIKKQKGTGTARAGDIKNPIFIGGGTVFGPRPRKYTQTLNKKVKRLARKSALSLKAENKNIIVLDSLDFETPKTKEFVDVLKALGVENKKSLIVLDDANKNVYLSSRNVKRTKAVTSSLLNTYDIMNADNLILLEGSLTQIEANLSK
ncbi:MAG TPA: 50S ribosomal protein L4 [Flavobacteriaceae bacterium]|nr:50S ribosomal protein L4 [Flavobacteriaceae bacterium]